MLFSYLEFSNMFLDGHMFMIVLETVKKKYYPSWAKDRR